VNDAIVPKNVKKTVSQFAIIANRTGKKLKYIFPDMPALARPCCMALCEIVIPEAVVPDITTFRVAAKKVAGIKTAKMARLLMARYHASNLSIRVEKGNPSLGWNTVNRRGQYGMYQSFSRNAIKPPVWEHKRSAATKRTMRVSSMFVVLMCSVPPGSAFRAAFFLELDSIT